MFSKLHHRAVPQVGAVGMSCFAFEFSHTYNEFRYSLNTINSYKYTTAQGTVQILFETKSESPSQHLQSQSSFFWDTDARTDRRGPHTVIRGTASVHVYRY